MSERRILNSWKEIASYLGRGVRTVQRWESQLGLPIHRPSGKDHSAVLAFSSELDQWLNSRPMRQSMHSELLLVSTASPQLLQVQALLAKAEVMLQKLDALCRRNDEIQQKLSLILDIAEERSRRNLPSAAADRGKEIGAA